MRQFNPLLPSGLALTLALVIAGCTPGGQFDPTELLSADIFNTKKKIPGDREPLFPSGVPGAETGVPPDLVKGYQPPPEQAAQAADNSEAAAKAAAEAAKPKPKPKPKPKVAHVPPAPKPPPGQPAQSAWPSPQPAQPAATNWPAPPQPGQQNVQTNWPAPPQPGQQNVQTNWPAPPATGQAQ